MKLLSRVRLFVTSWTVAYRAPPSMGLSRQEYWSGVPFPSSGHLPKPGIKLASPELQEVSCIACGFFTDWVTILAVINKLQWFKAIWRGTVSLCNATLTFTFSYFLSFSLKNVLEGYFNNSSSQKINFHWEWPSCMKLSLERAPAFSQETLRASK